MESKAVCELSDGHRIVPVLATDSAGRTITEAAPCEACDGQGGLADPMVDCPYCSGGNAYDPTSDDGMCSCETCGGTGYL